MEKVRVLIQKTINLSKQTFLSSYDENPDIIASDISHSDIHVIKNIIKSKSENDLDKFKRVEETWGWFIDPNDIMKK